ncbi:LysR family cys regulon transcriptional activator [Nitrosospira sp. Nsp5]|jgi:LysR family cys regulon transcriptional activator|uniref:LysR family transcriptional regulator, cys regulon transcriptional activator n=1 Tax=Nitrosospira multiformis TaxID=1231 RepID=A0ABY0T961_9PROT|nr:MULTISPECIES: CysB family HTH-type transcriptional regulator [Nitrosospira]PTR08026.1 LysR family cys regulon transcriptional activator [Nitrosospira sp. Nsp5]SCY19475.1 LysR family transcriptional regulator, cys regulon transcriptional activator [Nitrosospira sp. Nsp13]SDQ47080.1 LysR family transcriptional regulator, cys regulon transcriptional activator [Nitrosospira multiformis]
MNFQQLRIVRETVRQNFNLTETGKALFTSQSGISKGLKELEDELGVEIFSRFGKRLVGLTEAGSDLLKVVNRILLDAENIKRVASQFSGRKKGNLTVATTHTQARYVLPDVIKRFMLDVPEVHLSLHQGSPKEIAELLLSGDADIGIATETLAQIPDLISFPCYEWEHGIIVPNDHPLLAVDKVTLEDLSKFPVITYHPSFTGRSHVDHAFRKANLEPDIVITAMDADVIKTYVGLGLGIGVVSSLAFSPERDVSLALIPAGHLFGSNFARIAVRRGHYLRAYAYDFIGRLAPDLTESALRQKIYA